MIIRLPVFHRARIRKLLTISMLIAALFVNGCLMAPVEKLIQASDRNQGALRDSLILGTYRGSHSTSNNLQYPIATTRKIPETFSENDVIEIHANRKSVNHFKTEHENKGNSRKATTTNYPTFWKPMIPDSVLKTTSTGRSLPLVLPPDPVAPDPMRKPPLLVNPKRHEDHFVSN